MARGGCRYQKATHTKPCRRFSLLPWEKHQQLPAPTARTGCQCSPIASFAPNARDSCWGTHRCGRRSGSLPTAEPTALRHRTDQCPWASPTRHLAMDAYCHFPNGSQFFPVLSIDFLAPPNSQFERNEDSGNAWTHGATDLKFK